MTTANGATMELLDKSTNVRPTTASTSHPRKKRARTSTGATADVRWAAFQLLSRLAPGLAGRLAAKLFLAPPPPRPLSAKTLKLLQSATDRFRSG